MKPLPVVEPDSVIVPAELLKLPATFTMAAFAAVPELLRLKVPPLTVKEPPTSMVRATVVETKNEPALWEKLPPTVKLPAVPPSEMLPEPVLVTVKLPLMVVNAPAKARAAV